MPMLRSAPRPQPPTTTYAHPRTGWSWKRSDEPMTVAPAIPGADRGGTLEQYRLGITLERRMLLEGTWRRMLREFGFWQLSRVRAEVVGAYDISSNVFKQVIRQISTLYDTAPTLRSRDTAAVDRILSTAKRTGIWGSLAQHQMNVNAYRTSTVRYAWTSRGVRATPISPDFIYAEAADDDPSRPVLIRQAVWRVLPDGYGAECGWTIDEWDLRDPVWPRFRILTATADPDDTAPRDDLTAYYVSPGRPSDWWGRRYSYRDMDGRPLAPYRHDHARQTGRLWNATEHAEVVHGTLQVGLLMTAFNHAALRASWTQRVLLNGDVPAATPLGEDDEYGGRNAQNVEVDPTAILRVTDDGRGNGASIDEWGVPVDLDTYLTVVERRAQGLAVHFGLSPADVVIDSAQTAASGVSIKVSREGQRKMEARQAPIFEAYDEYGLEIMAALDRAHAGVKWDPREVSMDYAFTEMDPEQRGALLELLQAEKAEGLISQRQMYARLNRVSEEEAAEALLIVARQDGAVEAVSDVVDGGPVEPEPADPQAVTTTTNAAILAAETLPKPDDEGDAMADDDLGRLKAALERFGVEVLIGADVPEGTRGLTTYDAARIDVGSADVADQVIVLAHEGGHWLEHVRTAGQQSDDPRVREVAAFDLGWMLIRSLGLDVAEDDYRALHEEALARLEPVERSEAVAIVEDAAGEGSDAMTDRPKVLISALIPPAVHAAWEAAQADIAERVGADVWDPVGSPHITVLYLGEVDGDRVDDVERAVRARLSGQKPVSLSLAGVGTFDPSEASDGRIPAYLTVRGDDLAPVHADLDAEVGGLGDRERFPEYVPHITLGYLAGDVPESVLSEVRGVDVEGLTWDVAQLVISARDEEIAAVPMAGAVDAFDVDAFTEEFRSKRFKQPDGVRGNAAKVLRWKDEHGDAVEGMTETGWRRARQLAEADDVSGQDLIDIAAWFARFAKQDQDYSKASAEHSDEPWRDAGHVAWEGWGGDSARTWASEIVERNR